jgi:hypothetical protein
MQKQNSMALVVIVRLLLLTAVSAKINVVSRVALQTRRLLNLGSTFSSAVNSLPYDRIAGHPVFAVTTPWGSPYLNVEKLDDLDETVQTTATTTSSKKTKTQSLSEEQSEIRMVALYFMDPDDAIAVHGEMKQMENMEKADIRLTSFSLAKALRQASNLGNGLPTGMAIDPLTGDVSIEDGGALRYKIVPPKKQLFYAARCMGKERVGLWSDSRTEDAANAVTGSSALSMANLIRRREKRERKNPRPRQLSRLQAQNIHMEGYTGIPVFYSPQMHKKYNILKRVLSGSPREEIPLFFNYEDLERAYAKIRKPSQAPSNPTVEVFNLWDVLTSMDRQCQHDWISNWKRRLLQLRPSSHVASSPSLNDITFVASSDAVAYKDAISRRGNGKARLRPMR